MDVVIIFKFVDDGFDFFNLCCTTLKKEAFSESDRNRRMRSRMSGGVGPD